MAMPQEYKNEWQRKQRRDFKNMHGFSTAANYSNGKIRLDVMKRDGFSCVSCGMTDEQHKVKWGRPITVDHKDKDRNNNTMDNLQTLCLSCHGSKDIVPRLKTRKIPIYKIEIMQMRAEGKSYRAIVDALDLGTVSVWEWHKKWEKELTNE